MNHPIDITFRDMSLMAPTPASFGLFAPLRFVEDTQEPRGAKSDTRIKGDGSGI